MFPRKLTSQSLQKIKKILLVLVLIVAVGSTVNFAHAQPADSTGTAVQKAPAPAQSNGNGLIFIAAAVCVGFSSLAAGWAVSTVGAAAMGAISEKPELAGRALIFVGLAEGIAIYGLIVAIMILGKA